jgi:hypothetical protein
MYIIPIAWAYVAVMIAATEESLFRGLIALFLWGVIPVGLFVFFAGSPGRRRKRAEEQAMIDQKRATEAAKLASLDAHPAPADGDNENDTKKTL